MPEYTRLLREFGNASGVVHRTRFLCVILWHDLRGTWDAEGLRKLAAALKGAAEMLEA